MVGESIWRYELNICISILCLFWNIFFVSINYCKPNWKWQHKFFLLNIEFYSLHLSPLSMESFACLASLSYDTRSYIQRKRFWVKRAWLIWKSTFEIQAFYMGLNPSHAESKVTVSTEMSHKFYINKICCRLRRYLFLLFLKKIYDWKCNVDVK